MKSFKPCGKYIYHHPGKGNVHCQEGRLCKKCEEIFYRVYVGRSKKEETK